MKRQISIQMTAKNDNESFSVSKAVDPEFIMWQNIGISKTQRKCRKILSGLVVLLVIITSQSTLISLNNRKQEFMKSQNLNDCSVKINKKMAFLDSQLEPGSQQGFMSCFCYNLQPNETVEFEDGVDYCQLFRDNLWLIQRNIYLYTIIISIVNFFGQLLLIFASKNEKFMNATEESARMFQLIFIQQFISIGVGYEVSYFIQENYIY